MSEFENDHFSIFAAKLRTYKVKLVKQYSCTAVLTWRDQNAKEAANPIRNANETGKIPTKTRPLLLKILPLKQQQQQQQQPAITIRAQTRIKTQKHPRPLTKPGSTTRPLRLKPYIGPLWSRYCALVRLLYLNRTERVCLTKTIDITGCFL